MVIPKIAPSQRWLLLAPLLQFFGLAYLIAWSPIPLLGWIAADAGLESWIELSRLAESDGLSDHQLSTPDWLIYAITRLQDFAFSLSGLVMIIRLQGWQGLRALGYRLLQWRMNRLSWLVVVLPLFLYLVATVSSSALGSFQWSSGQLWQALFSIEAGLMIALLLRGPMGEELGLRGFSLPYLQTFTTPFIASLVIGFFWASWHLPVLLDRDPVSVIAFLIVAFLLSFIFTWLFNRSGGSLIGVLLFHAFQNNEETFEVFFAALAGTDWETFSTLGLLLVGVGFAIAVWRDTGDTAVKLPQHVA